MSYDYNQLVSQFFSTYRSEEWQQAADTIEELSQHCPLTPLLWILYANTTYQVVRHSQQECTPDVEKMAHVLQQQVMELGLQEFPGSILLHSYLLETESQHHPDNNNDNTTPQRLSHALSQVGNGSHRGPWALRLLQTNLTRETLLRCAHLPLDHQDLTQLAKEHFPHDAQLLEEIEDARRWEAKHWRQWDAYEDSIQTAMTREGIAQLPCTEDWKDTILRKDLDHMPLYGMGIGGRATAKAFCAYALAVHDYVVTVDDHRNILNQTLVVGIWERAVAECPTVEMLWQAYLRYLRQQDPAQAWAVSLRAARNCPYSLQLAKMRLQCLVELAIHSRTVLDPDIARQVVQQALDNKFLPTQDHFLQLHLTSLRIIKQYILHLLSKGGKKAYDDSLAPMAKPTALSSSTEEDIQEIRDLMEDLKDFYESAEEEINERHQSWSMARALLLRDRAETTFWLLDPLERILDGSQETQADNQKPNQKPNQIHFTIMESMIKTHRPVHPDVYADYVDAFMLSLSEPTKVEHVAQRLQHVRWAYEKGVSMTGPPKKEHESISLRDYNVSLSSLADKWIQFETTFGSERSIGKATKAMNNKMKHVNLSNVLPAVNSVAPEHKSLSDEIAVCPADEALKVAFHGETPAEIKERLGHKFHPFTVKVSNLSQDTEDMDLVDLFCSKCGPIVHARIVREKHPQGHGASKGWGLVQFEDKESATKAVELHDVIGLKESLLAIERYHMAAVSVVPPGMHRVHDKGQGRSTKRNQVRKRKKRGESVGDESQASEPRTVAKPDIEMPQGVHVEKKPDMEVDTKNSSLNVLSLRPRIVSGVSRKKPKVVLSDTTA